MVGCFSCDVGNHQTSDRIVGLGNERSRHTSKIDRTNLNKVQNETTPLFPRSHENLDCAICRLSTEILSIVSTKCHDES